MLSQLLLLPLLLLLLLLLLQFLRWCGECWGRSGGFDGEGRWLFPRQRILEIFNFKQIETTQL